MSFCHVAVDRGIKGTYGKGHGHEQKDKSIEDGQEHGHLLSDTSFVGPLGNEATRLHPAVHPITTTPRHVARNPVTVLEPHVVLNAHEHDSVLNGHEHDADDVLTPNVSNLKPHDDVGHDHDHDHESLTRDPSPSSCSKFQVCTPREKAIPVFPRWLSN